MLLDRHGLKVETPDAAAIAVENTADPGALAPRFAELSRIAIAFPGFADGRGFTLAKRLRRLGYSGILRAVGPLIPDEFAYALACGFDEVELPEASVARQTPEQWMDALATHVSGYQQGYATAPGILDRRLAAARSAGP
jgi:uncharacterized protein (DUF934 family)